MDISGISPDAEDLAEHQLSTGRSPPYAKLGRTKEERKGKRVETVRWDLHPVGEAEGDSCLWGNQLGQKRSIWGCQRVKQLILDSLNGVRTTQNSVLWPYAPQIGMLLRSGVWGLERNPRARTAVDSGEMTKGESREEMPVEESWVQPLNHTQWAQSSPSLYLPTPYTGNRQVEKDPREGGLLRAWCAK